MTTQTVGSRELAAEVALRHMEKAEDFVRYMPTVQHWIRANLFDAAGVGAVEQNPRRGKSRRFPVEALQWVRLFATLAARGVATTEIAYVAVGNPVARDPRAGYSSAASRRQSVGPPDQDSAGRHEQEWRAWARPAIHLVS
jgi:hypothetical protein